MKRREEKRREEKRREEKRRKEKRREEKRREEKTREEKTRKENGTEQKRTEQEERITSREYKGSMVKFKAWSLYCIVSLDKNLFHIVSLYPGVQMGRDIRRQVATTITPANYYAQFHDKHAVA